MQSIYWVLGEYNRNENKSPHSELIIHLLHEKSCDRWCSKVTQVVKSNREISYVTCSKIGSESWLEWSKMDDNKICNYVWSTRYNVYMWLHVCLLFLVLTLSQNKTTIQETILIHSGNTNWMLSWSQGHKRSGGGYNGGYKLMPLIQSLCFPLRWEKCMSTLM